MDKTKSKFALWIYPETMEKVESLYQGDNCRSKSEFIEKAVNFYCGYLSAEKASDYLPDTIISAVRGSLDSLENRMANLLFKNAVEISMLLHVIAATNDVDDETLSSLRALCVQSVKKIHGTIRMEDAVRFQKG